MSAEFHAISRDANLDVATVMLSFGAKKPIAVYKDCWIYLMAGELRIPTTNAVYGIFLEGTWFLSANVSKLIAEIDRKDP